MPAVYEDLELPLPKDPSRPYVVINMVVSVDGVSSVDGRASGIGGEPDRRAMRALRSGVDAVMVGAGTVRAEKLNLGLDDPGARQPLAVIVAGSGPVPIREHLVRDPESPQEVLVFRPEDPHAKDHRKQAHDSVWILPVPANGDGRVDLRFCLEVLRREHGVDRLLVEGGPSLNGALITNHLADELFITLAPKLMHANPTQISEPASRSPQDLQLLSFYQQNGEIFLRYAI